MGFLCKTRVKNFNQILTKTVKQNWVMGEWGEGNVGFLFNIPNLPHDDLQLRFNEGKRLMRLFLYFVEFTQKIIIPVPNDLETSRKA